ncbi:MAG TPA: thiol:disulfide interchange protein, partial [Crocinitomicaceae bacterium]|nr:thiol:disulfide interchange protein [Crocinitomicaceae bacterium]
ALPFTLFDIFPGWLNSLPQSGGWLNSVKVVLGLLELALALKFLSGVDLAYRWGILTRELFIASWVVIFAMIGFYLLGKLRFSHDSPVEKLSVTRFMFALLSLVFTVYLIPGMLGAPLKLIDGVAPPRSHSEDHFKFVTGYGNSNTNGSNTDDTLYHYTSQMHEVDGGIRVFHDLKTGEEYAKIVNKPILLDFTGYNCANCRRTESTIWTNDKIRPKLINDFVIVSLYVDDKTALPESEQVFSEILNSKKRYVGHNWSELQIKKYNQVSQPLYVVIDTDGNDLTKPIGYTPDIDKYHSFLQEGLNKFKFIKR